MLPGYGHRPMTTLLPLALTANSLWRQIKADRGTGWSAWCRS
jgi:hypothetical protein